MTPSSISFSNNSPVRVFPEKSPSSGRGGGEFAKLMSSECEEPVPAPDDDAAAADEDDGVDEAETAVAGELGAMSSPQDKRPRLAGSAGDTPPAEAISDATDIGSAADTARAETSATGAEAIAAPLLQQSDSGEAGDLPAMAAGLMQSKGGEAVRHDDEEGARSSGTAHGETAVAAANLSAAPSSPPGAAGRKWALPAKDIERPAPNPAEQPDLLFADDVLGMKAEITVQIAEDAGADMAAQASARNPAPVAHNILRQIGLRAGDVDGDRIEVTLTPEELGKVRLVILGGERPAVAVYADNPQTLDLLRRHADLLARELRDTGFSDADLSFADNSGAGGRHPAAGGRPDAFPSSDRAPKSLEAPSRHMPPRPIDSARIDIRI